MERFSTLITISLLSILVVSCDWLLDKGTVKPQPEWEADISFQGCEVYGFGIQKIMKHDDMIVAHTTFSPLDMIGIPDNRLCAIDMKTGQSLWFFPKDENKRYAYNFNGKGHLYKDKLVFRYYDKKNYPDPWANAVVCLDVETGEEKWRIEGFVSDNSIIPVQDVEGDERFCYFIRNESVIYCADLESDTCSIIKEYADYTVNKIELTSDKNIIVFYSTAEKDESNYLIRHNHLDILDRNTSEVIFTYSLETDIIPTILREFSLEGGIEKDGVLYLWSYCYNSAVDITSGEVLWERCDRFTYRPNVHLLYDNILLKCCDNATVAYDIHTGEIIYGEDNYGCWNATLHGKYVYLFGRDQKIDIIDIETGEKVDYIKCKYHSKGERLWGSYPTVIDDKLYMMSDYHLFRYPLYPWK